LLALKVKDFVPKVEEEENKKLMKKKTLFLDSYRIL